MRRSAPPFGNDLQDDFDVKVVGGKIVHVSKCSPNALSLSTDAPGSRNMGLKENVTASSSQTNPDSPKDIRKLPSKLPPIQHATSRPPHMHKNKFHSAPPKLHCPTAQLVIHPMSEDCTGISDDALSKFKNQLTVLQRKRPHTLEDVRRSCARLDDFRSGTIPLQELVDVLYVNGISVNIETLREFVEYNNLTVDGDNNEVLYEDFVHRITENTVSWSIAHGLHTSKSSSPFLYGRHEKGDEFSEETHISGFPSCTAMSCPEWQVTTPAKLGSCDHSCSIAEEATDSTLLSDLRCSFGGTRWGSHGDVQRLESTLAKADKRNTGYLPAAVVSHIFHDQCVPLRGELMDETFAQCEAAHGMIRWTKLMELIIQALSRSPETPRSFPIKTENYLMTNSELHTRTIQQEGIPHDTNTNDNIRQQAEELYKRISQHSRTDEPLQKLCNALYTCDPHRTGFLDVQTATRMVRNYNIVYRMGLDMTALESFITANSTHCRAYNKATSTTAIISISSVVNQLLQELDTD